MWLLQCCGQSRADTTAWHQQTNPCDSNAHKLTTSLSAGSEFNRSQETAQSVAKCLSNACSRQPRSGPKTEAFSYLHFTARINWRLMVVTAISVQRLSEWNGLYWLRLYATVLPAYSRSIVRGQEALIRDELRSTVLRIGPRRSFARNPNSSMRAARTSRRCFSADDCMLKLAGQRIGLYLCHIGHTQTILADDCSYCWKKCLTLALSCPTSCCDKEDADLEPNDQSVLQLVEALCSHTQNRQLMVTWTDGYRETGAQNGFFFGQYCLRPIW